MLYVLHVIHVHEIETLNSGSQDNKLSITTIHCYLPERIKLIETDEN